MLVNESLLKKYVDTDKSAKEIADDMTMSGSNVEKIFSLCDEIDLLVIGKILSIKKHPEADKLDLLEVDIKDEVLNLITGAKNIKEGDLVPVALNGCKLANGLKIKKSKIRGVESNGMLCSYEELGIDKKLIPESMKDGVWVLKGDYNIGDNLVKALNINENIIEFEITPNRPDCLSVIGLSRELAILKDSTVSPIELNFSQDRSNEVVDVDIVKDSGCNFFATKIIQDIKVEESPDWLKIALMKLGVRPINNVVDVTNYVMLELGQPMHAFDLSKIKGNHLTIDKNEDPDTVFKTLDGKERKVPKDTILIKDKKGIISLGGIMGGYNTEVTDKTNKILIEAASFDSSIIKRTSKEMGIRTEASSRFEKFVDHNMVVKAIERFCTIFESISETKNNKTFYTENIESEKNKINFRFNRIKDVIGVDMDKTLFFNIINRLDIEVENIDNNLFVLTPPSYRCDLEIEADILEEIARVYGYNNIPSITPKLSITNNDISKYKKFEKRAKSFLNGYGYNEILTYSFTSKNNIKKLNIKENSIMNKYIEISNPLGEETSIMRTSLIPATLDIISKNINRGNKNLDFFEIGKVFYNTDNMIENKNLIISTIGENIDFFDLKGTIEALFDMLNIKNYEFIVEDLNPVYHPTRCANILIDGHLVGTIGEVHPKVSNNFNIDERVYVSEINFEILIGFGNLKNTINEVPKYPSMERDLAIVVDKSIEAREIEKIFEENKGSILESYEIFDIYEGSQVPENKKSMAYKIIYRHRERTLKDKEVNKLQEKILKELENRVNGILR